MCKISGGLPEIEIGNEKVPSRNYVAAVNFFLFLFVILIFLIHQGRNSLISRVKLSRSSLANWFVFSFDFGCRLMTSALEQQQSGGERNRVHLAKMIKSASRCVGARRR